MTAKEYFDGLKGKLTAETANEVDAIFAFDLSGEGGGKFFAELKAGSEPKVGEGESPNADVTIGMTAEDFVAMVQGDLNPQVAFLSGKIQVVGEMGLALKLQSVLL